MMTALSALYGGRTNPGAVFVPVAGSAAQAAIETRLAGLRSEFSSFGNTIATLAPIGAAPLTAHDVATLLGDSLYGINAKPIAGSITRGIGDIELSAKFLLVDPYRGDIAAAIVAHQKAEGGWLSAEDLAGFRSRIEPVVRRPWRGHELLTCGPWCQGPALTEALLLAEAAGIGGMAHNSEDYLHTLVECVKLAMADREAFFGDPRFCDVPIEALLSPGHIAARAAGVGARAHPAMPAPILGGLAVPEASRLDLPLVEADTSFVAVVDRWGNAFAATPSDGSWNSPVVPGLGIIPSNRGSQSRPDPSHPSGVAPGKRPRLTPNPAMMVTRDGGVMPFGTPGGDVQIQAMLQVVLNVFQFGMELQDAIEAPRFASYAFPSSFAPFDYFPGRVAVEQRVAQPVRDGLSARGHEVKDWPEITWLAGAVEAVLSLPEKGLVAGGADPRRPAYAIAG
jgi:gamma-glutamyltranspeptidase/glutathione hydrolase